MGGRTAAVIGFLMATTSISLLIATLWLRSRIPTVPDLYSLMYPHSLRHQRQGTTVFLFVAPVFCCTGTIGAAVNYWKHRQKPDGPGIGKLLFPALVFVVFAVIAAGRFRTVTGYYGL